MFRIGHGYDLHKLVPNRLLILGGITIPHTTGLLGHSDADVLTHAVMDAVLGAAGLGDIGRHFPDTDEAYRGADSLQLARVTRKKIQEKGYRVVNIDATIIAQRPKLAPFIEQMQQNLAEVYEIETDFVNIKATTEEGLGFTGSGEAISAHAVALIEKIL